MIEFDQLWSDIIDAVAEKAPPEYALTRQQFAARIGTNTTSALDVLNRLVEQGRLETCLYRGRRYWWPVGCGNGF